MGKDQELIEAARNGDFNVVQKILNSRAKKGTFSSLRRGPGANAQDANGFSALHHAAVNRHKAIVELLLSHEASTNIVDLQGSSALHLAAWSGNEDIVKALLLTQGPSVPGPNVNLVNKSSETALHMAAQFGHTEVVKLLLHHGADPVITNERHETALDLAAQYGRFETVQLLLKSHPELLACYTGMSTTKQQMFLHTPLHLASRNGHRAVVEVLVKAGFDANARTSQGTALHEAALCGKVDVVKTLLDAEIDVCVADSQRRTAVDRLNEVGLKTPVAKEIAELIRNALKKKHIQQGRNSSPLCSPHETTPSNFYNKDGKLPLSQIYDNHSYSDAEGKHQQHQLRYSPHHSPKANTAFARGKTRRSMDVSMGKGPDFNEKPISAAPKKPPRRNLSASPTHPDFVGGGISSSDHPELILIGRNKSLDEGVYGDRWRKSLTTYDTSQSTESIDLSPDGHTHHHGQHHSSSAKSDNSTNSSSALFNGLNLNVSEELVRKKTKSKSQNLGLTDDESTTGSQAFVSVAHIRLRDAKSEQNVSGGLTTGESSDDLDHIDVDDDYHLDVQHHHHHCHHNVNNLYAVIRHSKPVPIEVVGDDSKKRTLPRGPKPAIAPKPNILPKPKNIKRQGHSYDNVVDENKARGAPCSHPHPQQRRATPKSTSMSVLSPVDVDQEWENITLFMDSFNSKDGENGEVPNLYGLSPLGKWLAAIKMTDYEQLLVSSGFDDVQFLGGDILDENSLLEIGILNAQHRKIVAASAQLLDVKWPPRVGAKHQHQSETPPSVGQWLIDLHLDKYVPTFHKNLYRDPSRLAKLCNDELITLLEIDLLGHRRRILAAANRISSKNNGTSGSGNNGSSVSNVSGYGGSGSVGGLYYCTSTSSPRFENGSGGSGCGSLDEEMDDSGSLPLRDPNRLVSGVSSALKTAWRHSPETLIDGSVTYKAIYVGSSQVHEFSTTDAIQKAIQEIRSKEEISNNGSMAVNTSAVMGVGVGGTGGALLLNTLVTLIVSASVVSWYNAKTKSLIKEQDIRSIQCTCQASDDLRHLALVTRAPDSNDKSHSCHVFLLDSVELATEAILTLGQAFEVAYQLALGSHTHGGDSKGHPRSKSANQLSNPRTISSSASSTSSSSSSPNSKLKRISLSKNSGTKSANNNNNHRSQSVDEIPPLPPNVGISICKSSSNSPQIDPHLSKDYKFPRAESFSFSSNSNLTRAPIVSKEEL